MSINTLYLEVKKLQTSEKTLFHPNIYKKSPNVDSVLVHNSFTVSLYSEIKLDIMKLKNNIAVSDSGFLFNPTAGSSYSVNPVGQRIIELLKSGKPDEEIIKEILSEYLIDEATIEKDLYDFKVLLSNYKLTDKTDE